MNRRAHEDPHVLEREIEETRASVRATLEALEHRLSPGQFVDHWIAMARRHGGDFAGNLGHSVKQNPLPLLLTSAGIAWLIASSGTRGSAYRGPAYTGDTGESRTSDRWRHAASSVKERGRAIRERLQTSKSSMEDSASAMRSRAHRAASAAGEQMERAQSGFSYLLQEQPLLLGAIGIAVGAIIGATLPATEEEDRLIGPARQRGMEKVKETGSEKLDAVREEVEAAEQQVTL